MKAPWLHRVGQHLRLLRHEPDRFGFNLLQFLNPARLQDQLLDMLQAPTLQVLLDPALRSVPTLNVLQPSLSAAVMTGGPNTVVNLALWIAHCGLPVRIVTAAAVSPAQLHWFHEHAATLTGLKPPPTLSVVCGADPAKPLSLGPADMFMATHWTTAQQIKAVLPAMEVKRFFYLIQDFEPGFYPWSSNYALALQTYGLDHIGVFNQSLLQAYFVSEAVGLYADAQHAANSLVFEPAVDRTLFYPCRAPGARAKRRLLFYARPGNPRNLLGLGLAALRTALSHAVFQEQEWEFRAIGGNNSLPPVALGPGHVLQPAPWMDYCAYAALLRGSDILLCPMLSAHTSYPVLEMAACGGLVVTNTFGSKTAQRLQELSANIVAVPATQEALAHALVAAALRLRMGTSTLDGVKLPADWKTALQPTALQVVQRFGQQTGAL